MIKEIRLTHKAHAELRHSWVWYEEQRDGLGDAFKNAVNSKIKFVKHNPNLYALHGRYRQAPVDNFPFLIVYEVREKLSLILIVSIFHTSRHPKRKSR
jgi:plasmid stabilization system protein ParE